MPTYEYQCRLCQATFPLPERLDPEVLQASQCSCGGSIRRLWGFTYIPPMQEHYNTSVGSVIRTNAQLKSEFARLSDEAEQYTGNPHKFVPIDPMDKEALGVTDEGLQATHDRAVAEGRKAPAQRLILP